MRKDIVFVTTTKSLIVNALIKALEWGKIDSVIIEPKTVELLEIKDIPSTWLLFVDNDLDRYFEFINEISDYAKEKGITMYVIGTKDDINAFKYNADQDVIRGYFEKPFKSDTIVDKLSEELGIVNASTGRKKILIIDDDEVFLRAMQNLLSGLYRVSIANSGATGMQMAASENVDLVLLDYEMPGLDGPQVLNMMRANVDMRHIPVMFLTSKNDKDSFFKIMTMHPEAYILKSSPKEEILDMLKDYFDKTKR